MSVQGRTMSVEEAIMTLGEESAKIREPVFVRNKAYQAYLVSHCQCIPLGEEKTDMLVCLNEQHEDVKAVRNAAQHELFIYKRKIRTEFPKANYVFLDYTYITHTGGGKYSTSSHLIIDLAYVPFALVGNRETEEIKLHYGGAGYPERIRKAATSLGVDIGVDYIKLYENEPAKFKSYFSNIKNEQDAERVVKLLADSNTRNDMLDEWLTKNFGGITGKVLRDKL